MGRWWYAAAAPLAAGPGLPSLALAQQAGPYHGPGMMWDYGYGWAHMLFGTLMMILFVGGIIVLVVLAIRWLSGSGHLGGGGPQPRGGTTALDILKERYARGEIDREEFEERRRVLGE